jgi:hypothetical protein
MVPDPWEKAADCERSLQATNDQERRVVFGKLRDLWIAIGTEQNVMTEEEMADDIEGLGQLQSELTAVFY